MKGLISQHVILSIIRAFPSISPTLHNVLISFITTSPSYYIQLAHVPSLFVAMSLVYQIFLCNTIDLKYKSQLSQPTSPTSLLQYPRIAQLPYLDHTTTPSVPLHCLLQRQPQLSLSLLCSLQCLQDRSPLSSYNTNTNPSSPMTFAKDRCVYTIAGVETSPH